MSVAESPWSGVRSASDLLRVPCLQSSALVGLGCAGCMLAHKLHLRRKLSDLRSRLTALL